MGNTSTLASDPETGEAPTWRSTEQTNKPQAPTMSSPSPPQSDTCYYYDSDEGGLTKVTPSQSDDTNKPSGATATQNTSQQEAQSSVQLAPPVPKAPLAPSKPVADHDSKTAAHASIKPVAPLAPPTAPSSARSRSDTGHQSDASSEGVMEVWGQKMQRKVQMPPSKTASKSGTPPITPGEASKPLVPRAATMPQDASLRETTEQTSRPSSSSPSSSPAVPQSSRDSSAQVAERSPPSSSPGGSPPHSAAASHAPYYAPHPHHQYPYYQQPPPPGNMYQPPGAPPYPPAQYPYSHHYPPYWQSNPYPHSNPYHQQGNPYAAKGNPYATKGNPYTSAQNAYPQSRPPPSPSRVPPYSYSAPQQFASRTSSAPTRFPQAKQKSTALRIPDDSEDSADVPTQFVPPTKAAKQQQPPQKNNDSTIQQPPQPKQQTSSLTVVAPVQVAPPPLSNLTTEARSKRSTAGIRKEFESAAKRLKKPSLVQYLSEWKEDAMMWEETFFHHEARQGWKPAASSRKKRKRTRKKRRTNDDNDEFRKVEKKTRITNVEFDTRFLQYDVNSYGWLDQLAQPSLTTKESKLTPSPAFLEQIPDYPDLPASSSRLGCCYQARVPKFGEYREKFGDDYLPGHDLLWDPLRADEAEKRGEDIQGFLSGDFELVKMQCLMELLHMSDYSVESAKQSYDRISKFGGEPTSEMEAWEGRKFERLLKKKKKDFNLLARKMQRNPSDCMIYYYKWKRTRGAYKSMKTAWKSDWCAICDDGGDLILCDKCERPYHLECLYPPVKSIPKGDWFCPRCKAPSPPQGDGERPRRSATSVYQPRQTYSPFSTTSRAPTTPGRTSTDKSSTVTSTVSTPSVTSSVYSATTPASAGVKPICLDNLPSTPNGNAFV